MLMLGKQFFQVLHCQEKHCPMFLVHKNILCYYIYFVHQVVASSVITSLTLIFAPDSFYIILNLFINLERTRDVKEVNRKCAFLTLAEKVSVRAFTIAQRVKLLSAGLKDRSTVVKQACGQMIKAWLRSYDHNIIKLLEAIDIEASIECSELMLEFLFKGNTYGFFVYFVILEKHTETKYCHGKSHCDTRIRPI